MMLALILAAAPASAAPAVRLTGAADEAALGSVRNAASAEGLVDVAITSKQSFRIVEGSRAVATLVTGTGRTRHDGEKGCFAAIVQGAPARMLRTIGAGEWEAETCGGAIAAGILSAGSPVRIGVMFQAYSPNAAPVEPVVFAWDRRTGGFTIDVARSSRASLAGATTIDQLRRVAR